MARRPHGRRNIMRAQQQAALEAAKNIPTPIKIVEPEPVKLSHTIVPKKKKSKKA